MPEAVPMVRVVRSGVEESVHRGSIAVVGVDGGLVASAGDPDTVAFARSCTKPFQAIASLSLIGEGEDLSDLEIAVMCGSHHGEPPHLEAVAEILRRAGLDAVALRCPAAVPLDPMAALHVSERRPEYHNCSGKHAGMLLACVRAGLDPQSYTEPDHPLQRAVLEILTLATGADPVGVGVDGCGVPVHAFPLSALARMFAALATPDVLGPYEAPARRALAAAVAEPFMIAGTRGFSTALMEAVPGSLAKGGAEGLECLVLPDRGLGVAVKIEDGAYRAVGPALVHALHSLSLVDGAAVDRLADHARPPVKGGGRPVGELVADFSIERG